MRAFLGQIGGRQVDRDPLGRQREADRGERRMDPLAAFGDRLVGQADDGERRNTGGQLDLDFDGAGFEPEVRDSGDGRGHHGPATVRRLALRRRPP